MRKRDEGGRRQEAGGRKQEELIILHLMNFGVTVTASCLLPPASLIPHPSSLIPLSRLTGAGRLFDVTK
jgi:hypothetical protein